MQAEKNNTPENGATTLEVDSTTNAVSVQDRIEMAAMFLLSLNSSLPKDQDYFTYLWIQHYKSKADRKTIAFKAQNGHWQAARTAIEYNDKGYHIYFGVNLSDRPFGEHERPEEKDIIAQVAIIADLDCKSAWHVDTDKKKYPTVEQAKNFLPFKPSILIDSGGGLHSYLLLLEPLKFATDDDRHTAKERNQNYISMIRENAKKQGYSGVDGVADLPRILRLPGTFNLKNGIENAPLCKVLNYEKLSVCKKYFLHDLNTLIKKPVKISQDSTQDNNVSDNLKNDYSSTDDKPSEQERALNMLKSFSPADLTYDEWLYIGMALKNNGNNCADWINWSSQDERFKVGECESKWSGFNRTDLTIATIHDMAKKYGNYSEKDFQREWHKEHDSDKKFYSSRADGRTNIQKFSADAQIDSLKIELQKINQKIADFETEKNNAIDKLRNAENFNKDFVFSDEILTASAFAKLYDGKTFSDFKASIQNQIKLQGTEKFITEWSGEVRDRISDIKNRKAELLTQQNEIQGKIRSLTFIVNNDELKDFSIPEGYVISNNGIEKICGEKTVSVCRRPAVIQAKQKNIEEKTFKFVLAYLSENNKWQSVPATSASTVFNSRKLIELADFGLPVTSTNANLFVDFLDAFKTANEKTLPMSLNVSRCGWYNFGDTDYFIDPRRTNFISNDERNIEIVVDSSSTFAQSLKTVGTLDEWRRAYELAKNSPVARLIVAASVAPSLLKVLGERNFMLYIHATTRAGKSTALQLAASAIGGEKIIRSFDGTKNGLAGAAADVNDYAFLIDEKQVADSRLKDQFTTLVYALANGIGRTKLNKDSTLKKLQDWRTIVIANGETELLDDNATGGAFTRLLQIHAPKTILDSDTCAKIRSIIKDNYGHALPLVIEKILENHEFLKTKYNEMTTAIVKAYPQILPDYCRYVAIISLAGCILDIALFEHDKYDAYGNAIDFAETIISFVPTNEEISDAQREKDFVLGFIAAKSAQFEGTSDFIKGRDNLGKFKDDFVFITTRALKQACDESNFDYQKVVADLIDTKFFIADDKPRKDRKRSNSCVQKICGVATTCYRIPRDFVS